MCVPLFSERSCSTTLVVCLLHLVVGLRVVVHLDLGGSDPLRGPGLDAVVGC